MARQTDKAGRIAALLREESTLALATAEDDGSPRVTPLFYIAGDDLTLYWFSSPASAHSRNLRSRPGAAATVYRSTDRWREIRGAQIRGAVSVVTGPRRAEIASAYAARFHLGKLFPALLARHRLYALRPEWIRYLDNSRRLGYRFELEPGP